MEHVQRFRRMNLDSDTVALGSDEYTYLKNGVPLQNVDGHNFAIGHVFGNAEVVNADLPGGTNTVVARCKDLPNNRVFYAIHNSTAANHTIYVLNSDLTFQRVIRTALLGFTLGTFIDMDISDNILVVTDNSAEIKKINVTKAIAGGTYTPTAEEITLIKRPPHLPLQALTVTDPSFANNYIKDNYFQFYRQYIYEDGDESSWSHFSQLTRAARATETGYDHNSITVNVAFAETTPPATVKQINYAVRINGSNEVIVYRSEFKSVGFSSSHTFYNNIFLQTIPDLNSFLWHYSVPRKCKSLNFFKNRLFTLNNTEGYEYKAEPIANFTMAVGSTGGFGKTHKRRGSYTWGLMFHDNYNRHAGVHIGAAGATSLTFPDRDYSDTVLRQTATFDISTVAQADIPLWATHYSIVRTQVQNFSFFLQGKSADIMLAHKKADGSIGFSSADLAEYIAVDISGLTSQRIGYTFNAGDRIRLWEPVDGGGDVTAISDGEIIFQDGRFIFARLDELKPLDFDGNNIIAPNTAEFWNFEIYRTKTETKELFFEIGITFDITNPGTGSRAFSATSGVLDGDCEVWNRKTYIRGNGGTAYDRQNPIATGRMVSSDDGFVGLTPAMAEMMNAHDKNFDIWVGNSPGRSQLFNNAGSLEIQKQNNIRFGQKFNRGSQISMLNIFYELDEYTEIPSKNGAGIKLKDADNVLAVICQNETTAIYVGEAFVNLKTGSEFLAKTDSVIGDDRKYFGGFGTLHPESVVESGGRVWYYDMTKGVIVRRSNDGLTPISDAYGIGSFIRKFSRDNFANRTTMKFHGGYDPVHHLYLLTAISSVGAILWTISFHEPSNGWFGFFDYSPQMYTDLNGFLISFNTGKVYIHNSTTYMNFYGVQKVRELEFAMAVRSPRAAELSGVILDADDFHTDSGANDTVIEITNDGAGFVNGGVGGQYTTITNLELQRKSGMLRSDVKRDINTPQPYTPAIRAKFEGNPMVGELFRVKIHSNKSNTTARMRSVSILYDIAQGDLSKVVQT